MNPQITATAKEAFGEGHEIFWFDDDGLEKFFKLAYKIGYRDCMFGVDPRVFPDMKTKEARNQGEN